MIDELLKDLPSFEHINSPNCFCNPRVYDICPSCSDRENEICALCEGESPVIVHNYNEYTFKRLQ